MDSEPKVDETTTLESFDVMVSQIFCEPSRMTELAKGEVLLREGEPNDRLYYVHKGKLFGYRTAASEEMVGTLIAQAGDLVGIKSYFSHAIPSWATIQAEEPSLVNYVTLETLRAEHERTPEKILMPFVCHTLDRRQAVLYRLMRQEQEVDRINFLGQFSAGVAHELNNSLAVIVRGSEWMSDALDHQMKKFSEVDYLMFKNGLTHGRQLSSQEVRQRTKAIKERLKIPFADAKRIAAMAMEDDELRRIEADLKQRSRELSELWELGATFNDVKMAAEHAGSVVESMRNLGARSSMLETSVSLMETLKTAIMICRNASRGVTIEVKLDDEAMLVRGNKGELVQVWTNLIKNACDALRGQPGDDKWIRITTSTVGDMVQVEVHDNGGGIPDEILPKIFLPNFTTKRGGLHFGLGLGLSIVRRVINSYDGTIKATNKEGGACFKVSLPVIEGEQ